jgi:signal transduction histidine kinase
MAMAADARRQAVGLAVAVLCLLLAARLSSVLLANEPDQVPWTLAVFVIPLLYALPGTRWLVTRWSWAVLAVQAALTWVPFALFGGDWQQGIDGLLAGLLLLMVAGPVSWLLAGCLLAADVLARAMVTGLPYPGWFGVVWVVTYYVDDAMVFFGMVRLAQIVGEVENARRQAVGLAVARERLQAARMLRVAVGQRLVDISANTARARRALAADPARARAEVAAAGATARAAVANARAMTAGRQITPGPGRAAMSARGVIGSRLARAMLVAVLLMFGAVDVGYVLHKPVSTWIAALSVAEIIVSIGLQVYGLCWLAWLAREPEGLRDEVVRIAAVRERLRVARDAHDLLGLGLSAIALKADLIEALIARDDTRAEAELDELSRICVAASADIRLVTGRSARLSLARELRDAREILASAGVAVRAEALAEPFPAAADEVLAPVLREAVTNILRHATATTCGIEVAMSRTSVRLAVSNDGVSQRRLPRQLPDGTGHGVANMRSRVHAAGGQLTCRRSGGQFDLIAEIPLAAAVAAPAAPASAR